VGEKNLHKKDGHHILKSQAFDKKGHILKVSTRGGKGKDSKENAVSFWYGEARRRERKMFGARREPRLK